MSWVKLLEFPKPLFILIRSYRANQDCLSLPL